MKDAARGLFGDMLGPAFLIVAGCLICQLGLGFGYTMKPLAGDIIADFGWTRSQFFLAQSPLSAVYAISSFAVGSLVGRFGPRRILVISVLMLAAVFALYSRMSVWWHLSVLVVVMGIALTGLGDITVGQLVVQNVRRGRGLALGIVFTGSNLGGYLLIPRAVALADSESWRVAFSQMSLFALLFMLPVAIGLMCTREREVEAIDGNGDGGSNRDLNLSQAIRTRSFWLLAASLLSFFSYFMGMFDHLVLYLTDQGLERAAASGYLRSALGMGIASKLVLGIVSDRIPHRLALLIDFGLLVISSLVLIVLPGPNWLMWVFVASFGAAAAARDVVYPLIIMRLFGVRYLAPIYGALMLTYLPGATLGPLFAAVIYDTVGSYRLAFLGFVGMNVVAFTGLFALRDERKAMEARDSIDSPRENLPR